MDQETLAGLVRQYRAGTATPEQIARLEKFWRDASNDTSFMDGHTNAEMEKIEQSMFWTIKGEIAKHHGGVSRRFLSTQLFYKVAATLLILVTASLWWYTRPTVTEIQTAFGERLTVTLPDQSSVVLNGNSILRYSDNWDEKTVREVWIEGEGFFSVTHTKEHQKFIVHAPDHLDVEVLGTKFNVKARHSVSEVMLTEGKVKLGVARNVKEEEVILKPGELATMQNKRLSKRMVKQREYTSWVENKLFFERTPLSELVVLLKDTYGLTVTFQEPDLEKRELSGEISTATADDILFAIAETLDLRVEKDGQSATISSKKRK